MKYKTYSFISLFLLMLVTGVFWGTWFTLTRRLESFSVAEFMHIGKVIIDNVAIPMRFIMPGCILFLGLSLWYYPIKRSSGYYFGIAAFSLLVITLLITLIVLVPIDNQIKLWKGSSFPPQWELIRDRWQSFHAMRTFTSVAGFASYAISVIYLLSDED